MPAREDHDTLPFDPLAERIARRTHRERNRIRLSDDHFRAFIRGAASTCFGHPALWLLIPLAIVAYVLAITVWCTVVVCLQVLTGKVSFQSSAVRSKRSEGLGSNANPIQSAVVSSEALCEGGRRDLSGPFILPPSALVLRIEPFPQIWKAVPNDFPDDFEVDPGVVVNDAVAQSNDLPPGDVRMVVTERFRKMPRGLANHFEIPHNRIRGLFVRQKAGFVQPPAVPLDLGDGGQNVLAEHRRIAFSSPWWRCRDEEAEQFSSTSRREVEGEVDPS